MCVLGHRHSAKFTIWGYTTTKIEMPAVPKDIVSGVYVTSSEQRHTVLQDGLPAWVQRQPDPTDPLREDGEDKPLRHTAW